jgi:hypothetical protein
MGDGWVTGQFGREIIHVAKYEGRFARVMRVSMPPPPPFPGCAG